MIAICPNPYRDKDLRSTREVAALLAAAGFESVICPVFAEGDDAILPSELHYATLRELDESCTLLVVIGGDGTILSVVRALHGRTIPVVGVNLGTKGFMTALEADELPLVVEAAKSKIAPSERMMLNVALERDGKVVYRDLALNDAVIHGYGECITITAFCNGERMIRYSGDGVILSTPTGSTGYSMSAGGPIVEPEAAAFVLSPICAHAIGAKPFVLGADKLLTITTEKLTNRRAYLSIDGNSVLDLESGDTLQIRRSEHRTQMARVGTRSFYETVYEKLT